MTIFCEIVSFINGRYKNFKIKVFHNDRSEVDGFPTNGSDNRTDFNMVPSSSTMALKLLRVSELTNL